MAFQISNSFKYLESALNARALRQDLISSNIANVDTPFYKPRDIDFEHVMTQKANEEFYGENSPTLALASTDDGHISSLETTSSNQPILFFRDGHLARNDGNSVDLDVETTEMSKNNIMYTALTQVVKKEATLFKAVVESSKNI